MKRVEVTYIYEWDYDMVATAYHRRIPSKYAKTTGKYRFVNGEMQIEVEEKKLFGKKRRFIGEDSFSFTEIIDCECQKGVMPM